MVDSVLDLITTSVAHFVIKPVPGGDHGGNPQGPVLNSCSPADVLWLKSLKCLSGNIGARRRDYC